MKYTIATGNLPEGFYFYGVFDSPEAAMDHANQDADLPDTWHVVPIHPLTEESEPHLNRIRWPEPHQVSDPNTPEARQYSQEYWEHRNNLKPTKEGD
jgi:hypothetical protein